MRDTFLETIADELHIPETPGRGDRGAPGGGRHGSLHRPLPQGGDRLAGRGGRSPSIRDRLEQLPALDKRREAIVEVARGARACSPTSSRPRLEQRRDPGRAGGHLPALPAQAPHARHDRPGEGAWSRWRTLLWAQDAGDRSRGARRAPFVNAEKGVESAEDALAGARDIIAERVSEDTRGPHGRPRALRDRRRSCARRSSQGKEAEGAKFKDYFDWAGAGRQGALAPHPRHAPRRERRASSTCRLMPPEDEALALLHGLFVKDASAAAEQVRLAVEDGYKRLLAPSMETEARLEAKERADAEAIRVFAANLRELLLAPPLGSKNVLAIDPGFRTGCKVVCLDRQGKLLHHDVIYLEQSDRQRDEARADTSWRSCRRFRDRGHRHRQRHGRPRDRGLRPRRSTCRRAIAVVVMVNESGASVYSASEVAREEFPDQDVTVRGAVSIGRRLMDPLAELVKIDPKSIGVGQYQHDVDQRPLKQSLDDVVVSCVNARGRGGQHRQQAAADLRLRPAARRAGRTSSPTATSNGPFRRAGSCSKVPTPGPQGLRAGGRLPAHPRRREPARRQRRAPGELPRRGAHGRRPRAAPWPT